MLYLYLQIKNVKIIYKTREFNEEKTKQSPPCTHKGNETANPALTNILFML